MKTSLILILSLFSIGSTHAEVCNKEAALKAAKAHVITNRTFDYRSTMSKPTIEPVGEYNNYFTIQFKTVDTDTEDFNLVCTDTKTWTLYFDKNTCKFTPFSLKENIETYEDRDCQRDE